MKNVALTCLLSLGCLTMAQAGVYVVKPGDTLYEIASHHDTSVSKLRTLNNLTSSKIKPGQQLTVPGHTLKVPQVSASQSSQHYTVRRGDSLYTIAKRYNTTIASLRSFNALRNDRLVPGQQLNIPAGRYIDTGSPVAAISKGTPAPAKTHRVRSGESLWQIASRYNVSVNALRSLNGLGSRSLIKPGQTLRVPSTAPLNNGRPTYGTAVASNSSIQLQSRSAMIVDAQTGATLYAKNAQQVKSIASITKLMTAMVVLDANLPLDETLSIDTNDVDRLKRTSSRLPLGTKLSRYQMLHLALMSSENRAASALSRHYPGGRNAFIAAMNVKARQLGMSHTSFSDPTGLTPKNVSTAEDLVKMVQAANSYNLIRKFTTTREGDVAVRPRTTPLHYANSNLLVQKGAWDINVSKTGYINEAGRCLVMMADVADRPAIMVFLHSDGKYTPVGDATRVKNWIESGAAGISMASL